MGGGQLTSHILLNLLLNKVMGGMDLLYWVLAAGRLHVLGNLSHLEVGSERASSPSHGLVRLLLLLDGWKLRILRGGSFEGRQAVLEHIAISSLVILLASSLGPVLHIIRYILIPNKIEKSSVNCHSLK